MGFYIGNGFTGQELPSISLNSSNGDIYCGGRIDTFRGTTLTNHVCKLSSTGALDTGYTISTGMTTVNKVLYDNTNDKLYVAGTKLYRFNSDGSRDTGFNTSFSEIYDIKFNSDGRIVIAVYSGVNAGIKVLNSDGSEYSGFTQVDNKLGNYRTFLQLSDGKYLVGGNNGGAGKDVLFKLNSDGSTDTGFTTVAAKNSGDIITSIGIDSSGNIFCCGSFRGITTTTIRGIIKLDSSGVVDSTFVSNAGVGFTFNTDTVILIYSLLVDSDDRVYVVGVFDTYNTTNSRSAIKLNNNGTIYSGFTSPFSSDWGKTIVKDSNSKLLFGGSFGTKLYKLDSNGTILNESAIASSGLTASSITDTSMHLSWVNNGTLCDNLYLQSYYGSAWHDVSTFASGTTSYDYTGLTQNTTYTLRIRNNYQDDNVYSNEITPKTLLTLLAGTIGTDESMCHGMTPSGITTIVTPSGSTGVYTLQWQNSVDNSNWSNIGGATSSSYNPPALNQTTYYRKRVISGVNTAYTNTVTKTIYGTLYAGQIGSNQTIIQGATPAQLTTSVLPTGSSAYYIYSWQDSTDGVNFTPIALTYGNTYQPPALYATTWYRKRVFDNYCYDVAYTDAVRIIIDVPQAPAGLGVSGNTCDGFTFYWENLGSRQGDIIVRYLDLNTMSWEIYGTYPSGTTSTVFTGLTYNQGGLGAYDLRVSNYYNGTYYTSYNLTGQNPISPAAPTNLTGTTSGCTQVLLTWINPTCYDKIHVQRQTQSGNVDIAVLTGGETQYLITGLTVPSNINYQIVNEFGLNFYAGFPYNYITPLECSYLESFCTVDSPYFVINSTVGNMDGQIVLNSDGYESFFDFYLTDIFGTVYPLWTDRYYVTAGYYFLTATPKPDYWYIYGRESCTFDWINVVASDSTLSNISKSIRNVICGGFGKTTGRISYNNIDTLSGYTYTARLYNIEKELVQTITTNSISTLTFVPLNASRYYLLITNDTTGDVLLVSDSKVNGVSLRSVAGIKKLWLTEWNTNVDYNYWSQSDENYYLSGVDANFFNSIKIKEFTNLPSPGYEISLVGKQCTFTQGMTKTKQGFVFGDRLGLTISGADNDKWKQLVDILTKRYVLVFLDNNGQYWTMGYRHGSLVTGYKRSNNEYILDFFAVSENKILTNLDENYVLTHIL